MTAPRPMSKAERAAMADALRHMQNSGISYADRVRLAGVPATNRAERVLRTVRRPA